MRWNSCVHRLDLDLFPYPKEVFLGNGIRIHVNSKGKNPLYRKISSEEDQTHDVASSRTTSPTHCQRAIPAPKNLLNRTAPRRAESPKPLQSESFSFTFSSRWHRSARKGPYTLRPVSQQSPQGCPRNSANIRLIEHRSISTLEGGMSAASFLHTSFLQAINAVMVWPVHVQEVSQASEHLCPAKLQTRCDICCACQSICPFIPTDSDKKNQRTTT